MKRTINQQSQNSRHLLSWVNSTLQTQEVQLEQLGNGVAYCLILHHYFPSHINVKKVCMCPRRQFDNIHNLRLLSQALASFKSTYISFDISKVANYFYHDNMLLLNKLYQLISKHSQPTFNPTSQQTHNKQLQFSQTCQIQAKISTMGGLTGKQTPLLCMKPMSTQEKYQLNFHSTSLNNSRSTTPVKSNIKVQSNVVETIKSIVKQNNKSDREKVKELKNLLGIQVEEKMNFEEEIEKNLLSEYNKVDPTIIIDQN